MKLESQISCELTNEMRDIIINDVHLPIMENWVDSGIKKLIH